MQGNMRILILMIMQDLPLLGDSFYENFQGRGASLTICSKVGKVFFLRRPFKLLFFLC